MAIISNVKRFLWRILTKRMHLDFTLRSGINVIIRNYADWCTYNDLFVNGEYREPIEDALREWQLAPNREPLCVLDLGANTGYFTLQLADIFLQKTQTGALSVCLVEASPRVTAELRRRLVIPDSRVKTNILNGLAGMREGSARLNLGKEDTVNFVGDATDKSARPRGVERVPYVDLSAATADIPLIHLIKCDIEGSEFSLIESYPDLLRKTRRIVIEFHSPFGDIALASDTLKGMGFTNGSVLRESPTTPILYFSRV